VSTAGDILVAAIARSAKNQADDIATLATELLAALNRGLRGAYAIAARVNPEYVGSIESVVGVNGVWARPALAESVWWVETAAGVEVAVVPPAERTAEPGLPSVYRLGRAYVTVGRPADPAPGDTLRFYCAMRPAALAALTDGLPVSWDRGYDDLLILDLACYMAIKDGRLEEVPPLKAERAAWLQLYVNFLTHETAGIKRRFGLPGSPSMNELTALLLAP
jgi:hypothetical protein